MLNGKKILITGGTGSFGRILTKEILKYNPAVVRIYSRDETAQFEMRHELRGHENLRFLIGDIREKERLKYALVDIDIVYHLAALKHVESCEYNPFEALKTIVVGTQNLIEAALEERVEKVIFTSTDKAVNPSSTMGASKLLAERLIVAANFYKGKQKTIFSSVRFGNVIGSRGSVIPLFERQIECGGPITITDKAMTRFVILKKNALNLVFKATRLAKGGEIFVFKMPVIRLADLADVVLENTGNRVDKCPKIKIKSIGMLPGEKLYEELMTEEESNRAIETSDMYIIIPSFSFGNIKHVYPREKLQKAKIKAYSSRDEKFLSKKAINDILRKIDLF
jgi:FlaA1/EpsC-like NDP-sugar epimerase